MNRLVHRQIVGLTAWRPFGPGLEVAETQYQALPWPAPRRLVVVRELIEERPEARGRRLFEVPGYTFHAVVSTLSLPPENVWRFYNSRADSENRLRELKDLRVLRINKARKAWLDFRGRRVRKDPLALARPAPG